MLGKACREKGELEGVGIAPNVKPSTPPNLPLASTLGDYNSHACKGEGLTVLVVRDSESIIVCIKGGTKLTTKKKTLPLDNHIQMLGKSCRKKGELEGVVGTESNVNHQPHLTSPWL